jgi:cell wall-associated NlpC family hydrolase
MIHHAYTFLRLARPSRAGARRTLAAVAASAGILTSPRPVTGQGPGLFETFATRKELASDPLLVGIGLSGYHGIFGLRVSGALHGRSTSDQTVTPCRGRYCRRSRRGDQSFTTDAWLGDVDLVIAPVRTAPLAQAMLLGFSPFVFAGIGGTGVHPENASDSSQATVSFGGGVRHTLVGWLGLDAEARYRQPLKSTSTELLAGSRRAWEYRAGLSIAFGGRRRAKKPDVPTVVVAPIVSTPPEAQRVVLREPLDARRAARLLDRAEGYIETPYRVGGMEPTTGFDAPGFVQSVYASEGILLPRSAAEMALTGQAVPIRFGALRPGDLLFFGNDGTAVDHVAIYVGRERIVHSSASGGGVRYDTLGEGERGRWFADHLLSARRVLVETKEPAVQPVTPIIGDHAPRPDGSKP